MGFRGFQGFPEDLQRNFIEISGRFRVLDRGFPGVFLIVSETSKELQVGFTRISWRLSGFQGVPEGFKEGDVRQVSGNPRVALMHFSKGFRGTPRISGVPK